MRCEARAWEAIGLCEKEPGPSPAAVAAVAA